MQVGDRVIWLGALDENGKPKGGWAGNGRGVIAAYDESRTYFEGKTRGDAKSPSTGPAVGLLIDQGDASNPKKYDVWVRPDSKNIVHDPDHPDNNRGPA